MGKYIVLSLLVVVLASSCVSTKRYNEMRAEAMRYENDYTLYKSRAEELNSRNSRLAEQIEELVSDTVYLSREYQKLKAQYSELLASGSDQAAKMLRQLEENQRNLEQSQRELDEQSRSMVELQALLKSREEAIDQIRRKVADALLGFDGKGLSVSTRNGMVYVSMDEKLLFRSGSFEVEKVGAQAIRELGVVLAANPDINIVVEGHTDNVPYRPNGNLEDNLDLSAKRATTVTRVLLENKGIEPSRITASGRGEYLPVESGDSSEARAKNRRTEIILSPKLDELLKLMDK